MIEETITPAKAERYLNHNKTNRSLRNGVVEKYADDMKAGRWTQCVAPIVFYENGDVADGQHRLFAIVESKVAQKMFVLRGVSREAGLNIDTGIGRSLVDNARISGTDPELSNKLIAVATFYDKGTVWATRMSNSEKMAVVNKYREPCAWAVKHAPKGKGLKNAAIVAAMARTHAAGADLDRLAHFAFVLSGGMPSGEEDSAAVALRNYIIAKGMSFVKTEYADLFRRTQHAIHAFLHRRQLHLVRAVADETYPIKVRNTKAQVK